MATIAFNTLHVLRELLDIFVTSRMQHAAAEVDHVRSWRAVRSQPRTSNPKYRSECRGP